MVHEEGEVQGFNGNAWELDATWAWSVRGGSLEDWILR